MTPVFAIANVTANGYSVPISKAIACKRQMHLPDSEPTAPHAGSGDEDKGRRLVRPRSVMPLTAEGVGLDRMEWT